MKGGGVLVVPIVLIVVLGCLLTFVIPLLLVLFVKNKSVLKWFVVGLLSVYMIILFVGVFGAYSFENGVYKVWFDFSHFDKQRTIDFDIFDVGKIDAIINLIMLIPIGLVCVYFSRKNMKRLVWLLPVLGVFSGVFIEGCQYVFPIVRSVQLSDVILNAISVCIGGVVGIVYVLIGKRFNSRFFE